MCLGIPSKIVSIDGDNAVVSVGGTRVEASLQLLTDVKVGDFVLLHTGFAIEKISPEEAEETLTLLKKLGEPESEINPAENKID
ncbi:MAG TPA: HypC/HybG/HupF family hydrogenase formation chaperone [Bacteroidales bacterium]|nr:HypC/HybG/HupF family hydrogenase formation chaperone [Bacteroidales bacterium]HQI71464.1 HypC/HybG/HupF family hydrogenase formation chaperone [Bacteroidales bacterium]